MLAARHIYENLGFKRAPEFEPVLAGRLAYRLDLSWGGFWALGPFYLAWGKIDSRFLEAFNGQTPPNSTRVLLPLGLAAPLVAASFGNLGETLEQAKQTDFFRFFHLEQSQVSKSDGTP